MASFTAKNLIVLLLPMLLTACGSDDYYSGYVEGEYIYVASRLSGHLTELWVKRGEEVKAGTALFQLDNENETYLMQEAAENLKAAEAQLENIKKGKREVEIKALQATLEQAKLLKELAENRFNRNNKLVKTGAVSKDQFDESESVYERSKSDVIEKEAELALGLLGGREDEISAAEANVKAKREAFDLASWNVDQKKLEANVSGFVQDTLYRPGEWVPAGRPVVSLLPPENIKVIFFVPEKALAKMQAGKELMLVCDACEKKIPAKISYVSSEAEFTPPIIFSRESRGKLVYRIEARLNNPVNGHTGNQQNQTQNQTKESRSNGNQMPILHPGQPVEIHF